MSVEAKQALAGVTLPSGASRLARNILIATGLIALGVVGYVLRRMKKPHAPETSGVLSVPAQITPFSVVAFLRRIQREHAGKLDEGAHAALGAQIQQIESVFFSGSAVGAGAQDLESVAREWGQRAGAL